MVKVTEKAMDAVSTALKGRSVKRYDVGDKFTIITRVTYDDKGKPKASKRLGSTQHG